MPPPLLADVSRRRPSVTLADLGATQRPWRSLAAQLIECGTPARAEAWRLSVPGRIEVLGKHTDYAGGRSLVCALGATIDAVCCPNETKSLRVVEAGSREFEHLDLRPDGAAGEHWLRFPVTVARRLAANFGPLEGVDLAFSSRVPRSAGASSSSALVVLFYLALERRNRLHERPAFGSHLATAADLASYAGTIENGQSFKELQGNGGVGTFGGSEDHAAILLSEPNRLLELRFGPLAIERSIAMPEEWTFVVGASGIQASKSGPQRDAYNQLALACAEATELWRRRSRSQDEHLGAAVRRVGSEQVCRTLGDRPHLVRRVEHFALESEQLVPEAAAALASGRLQDFGRAVVRSQQAAERWLGNQVPETIALAEIALQLGAPAASAFGAGFGGSVWALVKTGEAEAFAERWRAEYTRRQPRAATDSTFTVSGAGGGARWRGHDAYPTLPPFGQPGDRS